MQAISSSLKRLSKGTTPPLAFASILLCCLVCGGIYGSHFYITAPFPAPAPYPGATVQASSPNIGSGRRSIQFEYTAPVTVDEIQRYYEAEMKRYCAKGWQFMATENACQGYAECRVAKCEIPRP